MDGHLFRTLQEKNVYRDILNVCDSKEFTLSSPDTIRGHKVDTLYFHNMDRDEIPLPVFSPACRRIIDVYASPTLRKAFDNIKCKKSLRQFESIRTLLL